jgi:undecaprenyl-diphosphatase
MFAIWHLWFKSGAEQESNRRKLTSMIFAGFIGLFLARALALLLPFRLRPIHEENVHFLMPYGMDQQSLHGWSSFPSDHAVLFFSLSAGIYFVSRRWGIFLMVYTALFVAFPRLYLGLHYPSDLVCGMALGVAVTWLMNRYFADGNMVGSVVSFAQHKPQYFYPLFALTSFQITEMFDSVRMMVGAFFKTLLH